MGEVWVATDLATGGRIALKLLKIEAAESKEHRSRFEKEARIAKSLVSPHITRVSDSGVDEQGRPFMAMELLEGEDLQKRIKTEKVLPIAYVQRVAIQVGRALHVAHSAGLVHRDLKPANIFLARQGGEEVAKVLDFGIAKGKGAANENTEFTTAGSMLGTASYMSPEQIRNAKTVDHRADLWALAVVLFRALTGNLPFEETGFELFLALMQDPPPKPIRVTSLVPTLPAPLNVFFERSFAQDINQRYPTASAMIVGFCRAAGVTVPPDILSAADAPMPAPVSGQPTSGPVSRQPASQQPVSQQPVSGQPPSQQPVSQQPISAQPPSGGHGLSGTLMIDGPMDLALSGRGPAATPLPVAPQPPGLDPDDPDNAATLFLQTGGSPAVDLSALPPPTPHAFNDGQVPRPMTLPLDAARAAARTPESGPAVGAPLTLPQSAQPTVQSAHLSRISAEVQASLGEGPNRQVPRRARNTGLWLLIVTIVLLLAVAGVAVLFLKR